MRVAIFGAGYAGVTVARRLERQLADDTELVVVDESGVHLLQHELHRLVRYPSLSETITVPLAEVFERAAVRRARVTDVDTGRCVASLETDDGSEELEYDVAAVCLGSETAFYGIPGVRAHATPLKRPAHAEAIREDALAAGEGRAVIGGAGLSGVQVAGELAELPAADAPGLDVTLVEMADQIAPDFGETFVEALRRELEARGVSVETGTPVESADGETVHLEDGRSLSYDVFVWTGGIRGPDALDGERLSTGADLRVGESTLVVGDAASVVDETGTTAPASAQTAIRQGEIAAKNIQRLVNARTVAEESPDDGLRFYTYAFESPGWVVSVGDGAVAQVGPVLLSGGPARAAKAAIDAGYLGSVGAISRASALVREELGWPDAVDFSPYVTALADRDGVAEKSTELQDSLTGLVSTAETLGSEDTVDLTPITRATDRAYPGSPANRLEGYLSGTVRCRRHPQEPT